MRLMPVALLAACKFQATAATSDATQPTYDGAVDSLALDASIDAPPPPQCTAPSATCLDAVTLSTCAAADATPAVTTCNWGCLSTGTAHCGQLAAHGGAVQSNDLTAQAGAGITINTPVVFNTSDGSITGLTADYSHVMRGNVQIFRFHALAINAAISFAGNNSAAIVADGAISIAGIADVRGPCGTMPKNPGSGGGAGGNGDNAGQGMGGGGTSGGKNDGGGGAGYGDVGGQGGNNGGAAGIAYGDAAISVLVGGSGGGGGHNGGHSGGGGGGALQLASNTSVTIGAQGGINAGGCGGTSTANDGNGGGGGGGAGGTILIEAPIVTVDGALTVNGGAGGGDKTNGGSATLDRTMAMNGDGGGAGGAAATPNGLPGTSPGGGGGAVGRIRITTRTGAVTVNNTMSPAFADPGSTATNAPATVL